MTTTRLFWDPDLEVWRERYTSNEFAEPTHAVISDNLGLHGIKSMADGKMYDSKSRYYQSVRAHGCEIVGNETQTQKPQQEDKRAVGETIKRAIEELQSGNREALQRHNYIQDRSRNG